MSPAENQVKASPFAQHGFPMAMVGRGVKFFKCCSTFLYALEFLSGEVLLHLHSQESREAETAFCFGTPSSQYDVVVLRGVVLRSWKS